MAKERAPVLPDPDVWEPVQLRLIAFCGTSPREVEQNWFAELTGEKPTNSATNLHERTDRGAVRGVDFSVTAEVARVVLTASPKLPEPIDESSPTVPTLGPFQPAVAAFAKLAVNWLAGSHPPITRLAFAGRLIQKVKDNKAGCRLLGKYLHGLKVDRNSGDLIYRINRCRRSTSAGRSLEINRLATWSVVQLIMQATPIGPAGIEGGLIAQQITNLACVDLDINTVPETSLVAFPGRKLGRLFKELTALGVEIAAKGDVR